VYRFTLLLGALLLAPLNIAWMIQAWVLLGSVAYATPPHLLAQAQVATLLWLVFATTAAQVVAWSMESIRRGPFGIAITRSLLLCLGAAAALVQVTGRTTDVLDQVLEPVVQRPHDRHACHPSSIGFLLATRGYRPFLSRFDCCPGNLR